MNALQADELLPLFFASFICPIDSGNSRDAMCLFMAFTGNDFDQHMFASAALGKSEHG